MAKLVPNQDHIDEERLELLDNLLESFVVRDVQLQAALRSRIRIEQAKGMLAERLAIGVEEAFGLLRRAARSNRITVHEVADRVVASRDTPHEIARLL